MELIKEIEGEIQEYTTALDSLIASEEYTNEINHEIEEMKETFKSIIENKTKELLEIKKQSLLSNLSKIESQHEEFFLKSVTFRCHNGTIIKRNVFVEQSFSDNETSLIFFKNPLYNSEIKCSYLIENQECIEKETCKYNHGILIETDELEDPIDESNFNEGDNCFVCNSSNNNFIWRPGKILHVDRDNENECVVELKQLYGKSNNNVISINIGNIIKEVIADFSDDSIFEEELSDIDANNDEIQKQDNNIDVNSDKIQEQNKSSCLKVMDNKFGNWEKHTKGMGLKLLLKMGYEVGRGLGIKNQGIIEPVGINKNQKTLKQKIIKRRNRKISKKIEKQTVNINPKDSIKSAFIYNEVRLKSLNQELEKAEHLKSIACNDLVKSRYYQSKIDKVIQLIQEVKDEDKKLSRSSSKTKIDKKRIF